MQPLTQREVPPPINPHVWRKFKQAERNMLVAMSITRRKDSGGLMWNGNRRPRKIQERRARYWARHMKRLCNKLFP